MQTIRESILSNQEDIINDADSRMHVAEWLDKYHSRMFEEGRDYKVINDGDKYVIDIINSNVVHLDRVLELDTVDIRWPRHINTLYLLVDDFFNDHTWWMNNFNRPGSSVGKLILDLSLCPQIVDMRCLTGCATELNDVQFCNAGGREVITVPNKNLNIGRLILPGCCNIKFVNNSTPKCHDIVINYI